MGDIITHWGNVIKACTVKCSQRRREEGAKRGGSWKGSARKVGMSFFPAPDQNDRGHILGLVFGLSACLYVFWQTCL